MGGERGGKGEGRNEVVKGGGGGGVGGRQGAGERGRACDNVREGDERGGGGGGGEWPMVWGGKDNSKAVVSMHATAER